MNVEAEILKASDFGQQIEALVIDKRQCHCSSERERLLLGYWSLLFDYHGGILTLLSHRGYGSAFALVRPTMEAMVRAHLVLICSDADFKQIVDDKYRTDFTMVGKQIDEVCGTRIDKFLNDAREALHSFTHSGVSQLSRRFEGDDLQATFSPGEIVEVIRATTSAVFMVTACVTKHFGFEEEWKRCGELFIAWGSRPEPPVAVDTSG